MLAVLAWAAVLAAVGPLVRGFLTSVPDQRTVDLDVYRTSGLSVLRGQPLYAGLTQPPQLLPFTYPPVAALWAVPLALLPSPAAQLAWVPFIYVPLAIVIWFAFASLLRRVPSGGLRAAAFAAIFAVCAYLLPLTDEIRFREDWARVSRRRYRSTPRPAARSPRPAREQRTGAASMSRPREPDFCYAEHSDPYISIIRRRCSRPAARRPTGPAAGPLTCDNHALS